MRKILLGFFCLISLQPLYSQEYAEVKKLIEKKQFSEARKILLQKLNENANDDSAHFFMGVIHYRKGEYDEAVKYPEKCVALNAQSSLYYLKFGQALGQSAQRGGIFAQIGSVGRIKNAFEKAVKLDPKNFEARYMLVAFHLQAPGIVGGSQDVAKQQIDEYERLDARNAKVLRAYFYAARKEDDKFLEAFLSLDVPKDEASLDIYEDILASMFPGIVRYYLDRKEFDRVEKISLKAIDTFEKSVWGYWGYGRGLTEQGKYDEAIAQFERCIAADDKWGGCYYRAGIAYQLKGEKQRAIEYFEKYLSIEKDASSSTVRDAKSRLETLRK